MLAPPVFVALEVPLVRLGLSIVHEVHVLHPALGLDDDGEPDGRDDMHYDDELEGHHDDFQIDFDALGKVRLRHGLRQTFDAQELQQTE